MPPLAGQLDSGAAMDVSANWVGILWQSGLYIGPMAFWRAPTSVGRRGSMYDFARLVVPRALWRAGDVTSRVHRQCYVRCLIIDVWLLITRETATTRVRMRMLATS